jgi:hypothetical protein
VARGTLDRKEFFALRSIRLKGLRTAVSDDFYGIEVKGGGRKIARISAEVNASPEAKGAKYEDNKYGDSGEAFVWLFLFTRELAMHLGQFTVRKVLGKRAPRRRVAGLITGIVTTVVHGIIPLA